MLLTCKPIQNSSPNADYFRLKFMLKTCNVELLMFNVSTCIMKRKINFSNILDKICLLKRKLF